MKPMPTLDIQIAIEDDGWPPEEALLARSEEVLAAALRHLVTVEKQPMPPQAPELSLVFADDATVREINAEWREIDKPTNVLSFPMIQPDLIEAISNTDDGEVLLGDIILAHETCAREAQERGVSLESHTTHLIIHGTLHLIGHDHENDAEAQAMEVLEIRALETLGIADPYGDREPGSTGAIDETGI